ncbi:MAG: recombinase family protein [Oscillospiraceae bacterium]|nr:recombinase family protein [Oscillospiraceae bacterium]
MARVSRKKQSFTPAPTDTVAYTWNTALYVRLSVEDNGKDSDSVENQIAFLEEYVENHPHLKKVALFVDNGYTGTDFLRPEFSRMMEAVQAGTVDCIIVKDLSRLGRNYIETSQFIEKICPFYNLRFIAVNDNYDTATVTSEGQLSASLSNIVNDYYAKDISRKVTSALKAKMERGDYIGNYAPHGYLKDPKNKNRLIVDPETAPVVRQIFEWRAEGISYMGINKKLNDAGIPSPSQHRINQGIETNNNKKERTILWNKHIVTEILKNIVYIGHLAQKKASQCLYGGIPYHITSEDEWVIVKNTHEPLISEELFERVQQVNNAAKERQKANIGKYAYLPKEKNIYGKKFTCAKCGSIMKLHRSISRKKDKVYFTFKCPTYAEHGLRGCSDIKMRKADLDEAVFSFIKSQMDVFIDIEKTLHRLLAIKKAKFKQKDTRQEIKALKQKLTHKQSLLSDMYVDLKEGLLSQEEYGHHREIVMEDIKALEIKLSELESLRQKNEENITGEMKWKGMIQRFYDATEMSAEMADAFIKTMKLHEDGTLEIKLSYMDEFVELTNTCERIRKEVA